MADMEKFYNDLIIINLYYLVQIMFLLKKFCYFISLSFEGKQLRFAPEITIVSFQVHIWKFILDHVILALIENLSWSRYPLLSFILKEMDCGEMDFKNRAKQQQE